MHTILARYKLCTTWQYIGYLKIDRPSNKLPRLRIPRNNIQHYEEILSPIVTLCRYVVISDSSYTPSEIRDRYTRRPRSIHSRLPIG